MKYYYRLSLLALTFLIFLSACSEKKQEVPRLVVVPVEGDIELKFRGYVTDMGNELVSDIYNFTRKLAYTDTVDGRPVYVYISHGTRYPFYTDEKGALWQKNTEDIGAKVLAFGYIFKAPVRISYWKCLIDPSEPGKEWQLKVDTTFSAMKPDGTQERIRYLHVGKARYNGETETFIAAARTQIPMFDAYWYQLDTYIINTTSGDTLYSSVGTAHQYFHKDYGALKYTSDFVQRVAGGQPQRLKGTWEQIGSNQ